MGRIARFRREANRMADQRELTDKLQYQVLKRGLNGEVLKYQAYNEKRRFIKQFIEKKKKLFKVR